MLAEFEIRFMYSNLVDLSATLNVDMREWDEWVFEILDPSQKTSNAYTLSMGKLVAHIEKLFISHSAVGNVVGKSHSFVLGTLSPTLHADYIR
jgi:hypothetical protein